MYTPLRHYQSVPVATPLFLLLIAPDFSCSRSGGDPAIDGKQYTIVNMEAGKPETAVLEQVSFDNGLFDDVGCHIWGFGNGSYKA